MNDTVQGGGGSWISQYPLNLISIQLFTFLQFVTEIEMSSFTYELSIYCACI